MAYGRIEPPENRPIRPERSGGWWFGWWWIWLVILIGIFWFAGWGWGGWGGWWWGGRPYRSAAVQVNGPGGPGMAVLNSTNRQAFVSESFQVNDVRIQSKSGNDGYWVTAQNTAPILVVTNANQPENSQIQSGDRVNITGTVEKAPGEAQAKQQWKLSDNQAKDLEQQGVYVQASQMTDLSRQNGANGGYGANGSNGYAGNAPVTNGNTANQAGDSNGGNASGSNQGR